MNYLLVVQVFVRTSPRSGFRTNQQPDDLLFRNAPLHVRLLLWKRTLLDSGWPLQVAGSPSYPGRQAGPSDGDAAPRRNARDGMRWHQLGEG